MSKRLVSVVTILILTAGLSFSAYGAKILLKSGEIVEGKIVERTNEYIRVIDARGYITKYDRDIIEKENADEIEKNLPSQEEYHQNRQYPQQPGVIVTEEKTVTEIKKGVEQKYKDIGTALEDAFDEYLKKLKNPQEDGEGE
ncbi:MAG: hypothetical protein GF375_02940 [Candidatus Omnitrophica bacterium]|nr:hypothetical protein [Candidatus Omnitrophota bacterium]MBD3269054.1 hypothetical protein [Candidatus Omnitrophota bacterium]